MSESEIITILYLICIISVFYMLSYENISDKKIRYEYRVIISLVISIFITAGAMTILKSLL